MEHEGLVRAVEVISNAGLKTAQIITDRHKQNAAWIRRSLTDCAFLHYTTIAMQTGCRQSQRMEGHAIALYFPKLKKESMQSEALKQKPPMVGIS